jgi:hypothetical protein
MKNSFLTGLSLACCLMLFGVKSTYSQARNGIGFSYGFNKPFSGDYSAGRGFQFMGSIALTDKFALSPYVGYDNLKGNLRFNTTAPDQYGGYRDGRIQNVDLINAGIDAKYYLNNYFFVKGGALVYAAGGNEDLINVGIGLSGGAGLSLPVDEHLKFEFTGYSNVVYIQPASGHGITPYVGIRAAIYFDFGKPLLR